MWCGQTISYASGRLLRDDPQIDLQMLNSISAVDYVECFELVYHFRSLRLNTTFVLKARRCHDAGVPLLPLLLPACGRSGPAGEGSLGPNGRIVYKTIPTLSGYCCGRGFPGHPLRKDFIR